MKSVAAAALTLSMLPALAQQNLDISRAGSRTATAGSAENFTGEVRVEMVFSADVPGRTSGGYVTFSRGARSAWHTHPIVQVLVVTEGAGRVQEWGGPVYEMRKGDVIRIPAGVKHWHGAAPDSSVTHLAVTEEQNGTAVSWLEKVSDAQHATAPADERPAAKPPNTVAQKMFGDVAPKLADLTDKVLFDDVWARPGLSQRDRSLVTVSALIALNRTEQLRSHMARARTNGLTEDELVEALTHLAFYAGWPNAINAATVARDVFKQKP